MEWYNNTTGIPYWRSICETNKSELTQIYYLLLFIYGIYCLIANQSIKHYLSLFFGQQIIAFKSIETKL